MPIYDKPTKVLMSEFVEKTLIPGQVFEKIVAVDWFAQNYPNIRSTTVQAHVEGMAINSRSRKHHKNIKPGSGHDLFFKVGPGRYRLWVPENDPRPSYGDDAAFETGVSKTGAEAFIADDEEYPPLDIGSNEFAYERDLRNYLSKNLGLLEQGLSIYQDEGFSGIEFPAGGRYIDILAIDSEEKFVVIELKVSRGYDRTIGQLLRYMAWVENEMADGGKVRGIIVANDITDDLRLAASRVQGVQLAEYEISFNIKAIE